MEIRDRLSKYQFGSGRERTTRVARRQDLANLDGPRIRDRVVGYCSLAVSEAAYADAAERLKRGLARHPVPIMLLARLAVSGQAQGRGLGAGLLKDAMLRTLQAADIAGIRAFVVHAKDENARRFYEHFGFLSSRPFGQPEWRKETAKRLGLE